jgi:hypothetical protein
MRRPSRSSSLCVARAAVERSQTLSFTSFSRRARAHSTPASTIDRSLSTFCRAQCACRECRLRRWEAMAIAGPEGGRRNATAVMSSGAEPADGEPFRLCLQSSRDTYTSSTGLGPPVHLTTTAEEGERTQILEAGDLTVSIKERLTMGGSYEQVRKVVQRAGEIVYRRACNEFEEETTSGDASAVMNCIQVAARQIGTDPSSFLSAVDNIFQGGQRQVLGEFAAAC